MDKISILMLLLVAVVFAQALLPTEHACGINQEFTKCGSACPDRCNEDLASKSCIAVCVIGCQCKQGYLLNNHNECVWPSECEKVYW